jgi:hypothetical protein
MRAGLLAAAVLANVAIWSAGGAVGQTNQDPKAGARETAVFECVLQVREQRTSAEFDAFVTIRGEVRVIAGTDDDQVRLRACVERAGYSMNAPARSRRPSS